MNDPLDATGHLAKSASVIVDQISGVGFGVTILFLALAFSVFANILQFKRNNSLVDQILQIVPQATADVLKAVHEFKEAINELVRKD